MGGSGMAAAFAALALDRVPGPVVRDAVLPADTGVRPVICVSCSGDTGETLAVFEEARARGAAVGVVTRGGELLRRAAAIDAPRVVVPGGLAPRASLGSLTRGVFTLLGGNSPDWEAAADHVAATVAAWTEAPADDAPPPAAELAWDLHGRLPYLLGLGGAGEVLARRWAADLAENAEVPAVVWDLPEASHNALMTLSGRGDLPGKPVPLLLGRAHHPEHVRRREALVGLLAERSIEVREVVAPHADPWIETFAVAVLGSWVSVFLAELSGVTASDLSLMDAYKARLASPDGSL
jgi:glucose/mannose-6-phosphate isomerase